MLAEHPIAPDEKSGLHVCFAAPSAAAVEGSPLLQPCAPAAGTTVGRVCGQCTLRITTPPSSSIRTDTGSKLISVQAKRSAFPSTEEGGALFDYLIGGSEQHGGMLRPSDFAVLPLITSWNFVGCSIGSSSGLAPRKILST